MNRNPVDQAVARDIRAGADALDEALTMMCDLFGECASALPHTEEAFRLLRIVDATRATAANITASMRAHAARLET